VFDEIFPNGKGAVPGLNSETVIWIIAIKDALQSMLTLANLFEKYEKYAPY
jgi:hypothetical protein